MIAAQDGSNGSDCAASSLTYEELFSVLMYYGHMSKTDILNSSRRFLFSVYKNYVKRAYENLGISPDGDSNSKDKTQLTDDDYPSEFVSFSQAQREKAISESGISDEEYLNSFKQFKNI